MPKLGLGLSLPQTLAAGGFTPKKLSGLSLWLKADAGVTLSGSNVTAWADQSGNGNNATASGTPTLVANSLNSKSGISLDGEGSNDGFLTSPIFSLAYNTPISLFGVVKASASTVKGDQSAARWFMNKGGSGDFGIGFTFGGYGSSLNFSAILGSIATSDIDLLGDSLGENQANIASLISNGSTSTFYQNGTSKNSANNSDLDFTNSSNNGFSIGYQAATVDEFFGNCIVYELLIYNRALTTQERQQVEAYLANKYAIQIPNINNMFLPQLWLKADAGVTLSGSDVTAWADQSGNGFNANGNVTDGVNPTFVSNVKNGKPILRFGNNNDATVLRTNPTTFGNNGEFTIFTVHEYDDTDNSWAELISKGDLASDAGSQIAISPRFIASDPASSAFGVMGYADETYGWNFLYQEPASTSWSIICGTQSITNNSQQYHVNGSLASSSASVGSINQLNIAIGIGNAGSTSTPSGASYGGFKGDLAEVIFYNRPLTTQERQQVEAYLNTKYAIY